MKKSKSKISKKEYEVEQITDERIGRLGNPEFRVKWLGYPESESTWEPYSHLRHLEYMIESYRNRKSQQTSQSLTKKPVVEVEKEQVAMVKPPKGCFKKKGEFELSSGVESCSSSEIQVSNNFGTPKKSKNPFLDSESGNSAFTFGRFQSTDKTNDFENGSLHESSFRESRNSQEQKRKRGSSSRKAKSETKESGKSIDYDSPYSELQFAKHILGVEHNPGRVDDCSGVKSPKNEQSAENYLKYPYFEVMQLRQTKEGLHGLVQIYTTPAYQQLAYFHPAHVAKFLLLLDQTMQDR